MKILISCYACGPNRGSEPGLGWNIVTQLIKFCEVHAIVEEEKWKKSILQELESNSELKKDLNFYFIPKKRNRLLRKIWPPSYYWFYKSWQKKAYKLAIDLHKKESFDIIHQFNMIGYREPGYLWKIDDVPFVWGPIGGFAQMKWSFIPTLGIKDGFYYSMRNLLNIFQIRTSLRVKKAFLRSDILISASIDSYDGIKKYFKKDSILINETGAKTNNQIFQNQHQPILKIVWVGRMIGLKALDIGLHALSRLPSYIRYHFDILGSGPNLEKYVSLSKSLGIIENCTFHGFLQHEKVIEKVKSSNIMLFTSLQEGTPHVVLEALSQGVPVICHNANGHCTVIDDTCGIKVPMQNFKKSVNYFRNAIEKINNDRNLLVNLSCGAIEKSKVLSWENKAKEIYDTYNYAIINFNEKKKSD